MEKITLEKCISDFISIHGAEHYDYSLINEENFKGTVHKIPIRCKIHDFIFYMKPNGHKNKRGCKKCSSYRKSQNKKLNNQQFLERAKKVHGDDYEYIEEYMSSDDYMNIKHKKCGKVFNQMVRSHLSGYGCNICNKYKKLSNSEFLIKVKDLYGEEYVCCELYSSSKKKMNIKHARCGTIYRPTAWNFLSGQQCPNCFNKYRGENKTKEFLVEHFIKFEPQKTFDGCSYKRKLRFDFYLREFNCCVEFDGRYHFYEENHPKFDHTSKIRDEIKNKFCLNNGIKLIRIPYWEDIDNYLYKELFNI